MSLQTHEVFAMIESLNELRTKAAELGVTSFDNRFKTQAEIDAYILALNDAISIVETGW